MKFFKKISYKKFILPVIVILSEIFIYFQMIYNNQNITLKYQLVFLAVCIISNIGALIIFHFLKKNRDLKIEKLFLIIASIYGGIYLIFVPALLGTDELPHFLRPYQISVGDVIVANPEKNETKLPKAIGDFVGEKVVANRYTEKYILDGTDYSDTIPLWNGDVTSIDYSPLPYIPQIIGFFLSKIFQLSPLIILYTVRLCNFITWLGLGYAAFKLLPVKKMFALVLYTSPAVLSLVSTCSADAFSLGLFFVFISYILNLIHNKREFNKKDFLIFGLISIAFSTYKIFYVLYALLLFLIPKECFKNSTKKKIANLLPIILISFIIDFVWFMLSAVGHVGNETVQKQIQFILTHPFKYIFIFINTFIDSIISKYFVNLTAGNGMCYGLARINQLFIYAYSGCFVASYFYDNKKVKMGKYSKILIALVCLAIVGLVSTTLYLDWTSSRLGVGSLKIVGVQARYFWLLLIPIACILPNCKRCLKDEKKLIKFTTILNTIILVNTISSLLLAVFPK